MTCTASTPETASIRSRKLAIQASLSDTDEQPQAIYTISANASGLTRISETADPNLLHLRRLRPPSLAAPPTTATRTNSQAAPRKDEAMSQATRRNRQVPGRALVGIALTVLAAGGAAAAVAHGSRAAAAHPTAAGEIAFVSFGNSLDVIDADGSHQRWLVACPDASNSCAITEFAWSPDGRRLGVPDGQGRPQTRGQHVLVRDQRQRQRRETAPRLRQAALALLR